MRIKRVATAWVMMLCLLGAAVARAEDNAPALTKEQAKAAGSALLAEREREVRGTREKEWKDREITIGAHTLKWKQKQFGTKPQEGWNLYISMHGGGGAPAAVN